MSNILSPRFVVDKSKSWQKNSTQLKKSISENDNDDDDSKAGKKLPEPNEEVRLNFHRNFWRLCQCFCLVPLKSKSSVKFVFSSFPAAIVVCFQKANFSGFFSVGAFLKWFCSSLEISFLLTKTKLNLFLLFCSTDRSQPLFRMMPSSLWSLDMALSSKTIQSFIGLVHFGLLRLNFY